MSTTTSPQTVQCVVCNADRDPNASVKGSYCSLDCYHRKRGRRALTHIRQDHKFCSTCFRVRKEIEEPTDEWFYERKKTQLQRAAIVGFEYPTKHVATEDGFTYCTGCGSIDHDAADPHLRTLDLGDAVLNLAVLLDILDRDGRIDARTSASSILTALTPREMMTDDTLDWELAVGRALYG